MKRPSNIVATLAIEWLGDELPPWQEPCPIQVIVGPHLGAGGATTFTFINGQPRDWHMEIQGSQERILDSVLPHEITHTIFATHFGCPLPRWADEGGATSVEHVSERTKQDQLLIQFLTSNRGIAFNHMFAMKEYPPDILPLYSQGYSLARYLIAQGGKHKYVNYVLDGMRWNNWTAATQKHYGLRSLSELQINWLDWVRQGQSGHSRSGTGSPKPSLRRWRCGTTRPPHRLRLSRLPRASRSASVDESQPACSASLAQIAAASQRRTAGPRRPRLSTIRHSPPARKRLVHAAARSRLKRSSDVTTDLRPASPAAPAGAQLDWSRSNYSTGTYVR